MVVLRLGLGFGLRLKPTYDACLLVVVLRLGLGFGLGLKPTREGLARDESQRNGGLNNRNKVESSNYAHAQTFSWHL